MQGANNYLAVEEYMQSIGNNYHTAVEYMQSREIITVLQKNICRVEK